MKRKPFAVILSVLLLLLFSCATVPSIPGLEKIYVTNTKQINLLPPSDISEPIDSLMELDMQFGETEASLLLYVQADVDVVFFEFMNSFGFSMGSLEYDGVSMSFDCQLFPESLKPEYIVNDFQNAFYSVDALAANLQKSRLAFEEIQETDAVVRFVKDGKKTIEQITIQPDMVIIRNYLRNYEFTLFY